VISRTSTQLWILTLLGLLMISSADADRLVFRDGKELLGRVVSEDTATVTFATKVDGKLLVKRYPRAAIKKIIPELGKMNDPFVDPDEPAEQSKPVKESGLKSSRVVFLIDRSSSMALGRRFQNALKVARTIAKGYSSDTRLQIFAFDDTAEPILRSYQNVIAQNSKLIDSSFRRISVKQKTGTNIELAFKRAFQANPQVIHVFTDGVDRSLPGASTKILANIARMNRKNTKIHTHAFQGGSIKYFGGEPRQRARGFLKKLASDNGGSATAAPETISAQNKERKVDIVVTRNGQACKSLKIGQRYEVELKVKHMTGSKVIYEYVAGSPILMRSVDASKKNLVRRARLPLIIQDDRVVGSSTFVVVRANNANSQSRGYIGAVSGGAVAFFFDAIGQWVSLKLPVE
jgi:hypothetical protein